MYEIRLTPRGMETPFAAVWEDDQGVRESHHVGRMMALALLRHGWATINDEAKAVLEGML